MTANQTEILLQAMSSGEVQRLAVDFLTRLHPEWGPITQSGIVEGTLKTRKGTPDAFCERDNGTYVYIQATGDKQKGKILEDLKKSLNQLVSLEINEGALCVAFLNFDPQADEIEECKRLAQKHKCEFVFYSNSQIAKLLDEIHHDLRYKYLKIPVPSLSKVRKEHDFTIQHANGSEPKTAANMNKVMEWGLSEDELSGTLESIIEFYRRLEKLNGPSRRFFASLVKLAEPMGGVNFARMSVPYQEVANALGLPNFKVSEQMAIIEMHGFGYINDSEFPVQIEIWASDWPLLSDIKAYAESEGYDLYEILVKLQFSLLD